MSAHQPLSPVRRMSLGLPQVPHTPQPFLSPVLVWPGLAECRLYPLKEERCLLGELVPFQSEGSL